MVGSDILEHGRPGEVHNNYTSGNGVEVNPERRKFDFITRLILSLGGICGYGPCSSG